MPTTTGPMRIEARIDDEDARAEARELISFHAEHFAARARRLATTLERLDSEGMIVLEAPDLDRLHDDEDLVADLLSYAVPASDELRRVADELRTALLALDRA
jgi:hypothetical protein